MLLNQRCRRQLESLAAAQTHNDLQTALLGTGAGAVRLHSLCVITGGNMSRNSQAAIHPHPLIRVDSASAHSKLFPVRLLWTYQDLVGTHTWYLPGGLTGWEASHWTTPPWLAELWAGLPCAAQSRLGCAA